MREPVHLGAEPSPAARALQFRLGIPRKFRDLLLRVHRLQVALQDVQPVASARDDDLESERGFIRHVGHSQHQVANNLRDMSDAAAFHPRQGHDPRVLVGHAVPVGRATLQGRRLVRLHGRRAEHRSDRFRAREFARQRAAHARASRVVSWRFHAP